MRRQQHRRKRLSTIAFGAVGTAALAIGLAACGSSSPAATTTTTKAPNSNTVRILMEGPLSGSQAPTGQDMLRGADLAATQVNSGGGVLGKKLKIVGVDDAADPDTGVQAAKHAISTDPEAVIGPYNSSVGVKTLPLYQQAGLPILRLTSDNSTQGFGVTTQPMANQIAPVEARAMAQLLHAKSVAILYDPSTYTAGIAKQLNSLLKQAKISVPIMESVSSSGSTSQQQSALAQALGKVALLKPSITYLAMYGPQGGLAAKDMATAQLPAGQSYGQCFADLAAQGNEFIAAAGASAATCLASGVPSTPQLPGGITYSQQYQAAYHVAPGTWGAFTYDSLRILAAAVVRAGTWAKQPIITQLGKTEDYQGVTGTISFAPKTGNRVDPPVVILTISAGGGYQIDPAWQAPRLQPGPAVTTTTTAPSTTTTTAPSTTTTTAPTTTTTGVPPPSTTTTTAPPSTTTSAAGRDWTGKTLHFGAVLSTTGTGKAYAKSQEDGADLAAHQINGSGGVHGAKVQLNIRDDHSDPQDAASAMRHLASSGALAVLGPTFSNSAAVADPVANSLKLPVLAISNTGPGVVGNCAYPCTWIYRDSLGDATGIPVNVDVALHLDHAKPSKGLVVAPKGDAFAASTARIALRALRSSGVPTGPIVFLPANPAQIPAALTAALKVHPGILVVTASSSSVAATVIKSARADKYTGPVLGGNAFNLSATAKEAGAAGKDAQSSAGWYLGNPSSTNKAFVRTFKSTYGHDPDQFAAQAYTGVELLAAAARSSALTFTSPARDRTLLAHSLEQVELQTPLGPFRFTADHDVSQPVWVVAMTGKGGYRLVTQVPEAKAARPAARVGGGTWTPPVPTTATTATTTP